MRTIAFVSQKGGSGKSTIASSLAVAAYETKEEVCVVDMDPQGSLTRWAKIRAAGDIDVIASGAARLPALLASLERKGVTLAILALNAASNFLRDFVIPRSIGCDKAGHFTP